MMRIGQASFWPHGEPSKHEHDRCKKHSQYLKPDVYMDGPPGVPGVEAQSEDSCGYDEEEYNRCDDSMSSNEAMISGHFAKAITHS